MDKVGPLIWICWMEAVNRGHGRHVTLSRRAGCFRRSENRCWVVLRCGRKGCQLAYIFLDLFRGELVCSDLL
jgi:hypothetical protein